MEDVRRMLDYVGPLTRCRFPHQVILSIQDALIARHTLRDASSAKGVSLGASFGVIDRNILDDIEEVIEHARKTTKVLLKKEPEDLFLDTRGDGPVFGSGGGSVEREPVAERDYERTGYLDSGSGDYEDTR